MKLGGWNVGYKVPSLIRASYWPLILVGLLISVAVVVRYGMGGFSHEYFTYASAIKHAGQYTVDPITSTSISRSVSLVFTVFRDVYDIPFYHLLFGISAKTLLVFSFILLTWTITRSVLACFFALIMLFGLSNFEIVNLNLPLGAMSHEIRSPLYFSFRQIAVAIAFISTFYFVQKRFVLSSVVLAIGFYVHPINTTAFFVTFCTTLAVSVITKETKPQVVSALIRLLLPFLLLTFPYLLMNVNMFAEVEPISSSAFWQFILKNEPDDASFVFNLRHGRYVKEFIVAVVVILVYSAAKSRKPVSMGRLGEFVRSGDDLILPLLLAPWVLSVGAVFWESALIHRVPDVLNDIFIPLQFRRYPSISAFIAIPLVAGVVSRLVIALSESSLAALLGRKLPAKGDETGFLWKALNYLRAAPSLAMMFSFLIMGSVLVTNTGNLRTFKKFWNFEHQSFDYFLPSKTPVYGLEDNSPTGKVIPLSALLDVCRFVRDDTPVEAAFFNPTYIKEFRTYCERQGFLSEKFDGNLAFVNRKLASVYLGRFSDIHRGLTYEELPGVVFEGGEPYAIMRQRYLSLSGADIEKLRARYPGYDFILTEVGHKLPYRVRFSNEYFVLYDLLSKEETA